MTSRSVTIHYNRKWKGNIWDRLISWVGM